MRYIVVFIFCAILTVVQMMFMQEVSRSSSAGSSTCSGGWYVTGYYVPVETDFTGDLKEIVVQGKNVSYPSDFLAEVQEEGWGKTTDGSYLGWHDDAWFGASTPLDAQSRALKDGVIAVDPTIIPPSSTVSIETLPGEYGMKNFVAVDEGPAIKGFHIDVYTGEGKKALLRARMITSTNNTVCLR